MRDTRQADSDLRIPPLIFGCGNFGGIGSAAQHFGRGDDEPTAHRMLDAALERGITMFDTANSYGGGRSERWLGSWLRSRGVRDDVCVSTKVGNPVGPGPDDAGLSAAHIRAQIDLSLRRLDTDRVDLYLTHVLDNSVPVEETVTAFQELIDEGKIRAYGLSNVTSDELDRTVEAAVRLGVRRPVNLQGGSNLLERGAGPAWGSRVGHAVAFTAFSPLAGGLLSGKYRRDRPVPEDSRAALLPSYRGMIDERLYAVLDVLDELASRYGVAPSTVALAWVLTTPGVAGALISPRAVPHLTMMCAAPNLALSDDDRARLARASATEPSATGPSVTGPSVTEPSVTGPESDRPVASGGGEDASVG